MVCVLHQIHIQLFKLRKLAQTLPNCHSQKKRGEGGLKSTPKIGSRFAKFGQTISACLDIVKPRKTLIFRGF